MLLSPFLTMFSTLSKTGMIILETMNLSSANALNLVKARNLSFGQELIQLYGHTHFLAILYFYDLEETSRQDT